MNVVRFNEPFIKALTSHPLIAGGCEAKTLIDGWMTAPLFDVVLPERVAMELGEQAVHEWAMSDDVKQGPDVLVQPWPFPLLRASLSIAYEPDISRESRKAWLNELSSMRGVHLIAGQSIRGQSIILFHAKEQCEWMFLFHLNDDGGLSLDGMYDEKIGWQRPSVWYLAMNKADAHTSIQQFRDMTGRVIATITVLFAAFLASAMSPQTHMVTVRPNQPHRSIQWLQARTHYTLITHGHPANRPTVKQGERVQSDAVGELTRMAHNRRAHYRTLRSERFRYARGKRIFVRATWVGPKEWKDAGGKQIYHILEPVVNESNPLDGETTTFPASTMDY